MISHIFHSIQKKGRTKFIVKLQERRFQKAQPIDQRGFLSNILDGSTKKTVKSLEKKSEISPLEADAPNERLVI